MATNGNFSQQDQVKGTAEQYPATSGPTDSASGGATSSDLSKDEVGWYFVEQYYTTLSKSPEKLHLFYGKQSQFVSGLEAEVANVSVGRSAIQGRIKELHFEDCKVRVSNVDSQASFDNIVIQVIGETSNKSAELKKFVQTFVLAQQPTGYFVLNDIFRYISEEGDEEQVEGVQEESAPAAPLVEDVEMPKQTTAEEPGALDTEVVDKKLEEVAEPEPVAEAPATNGTSAEASEAEVEIPKVEEVAPTPEAAEKEVEEEVKDAEKPIEPTPSPALVVKAPAQPAAPPKPLSWANRAAAAAGVTSAPKPVVPVLPKTSTPPAQPRAAPPAPKVTPAPTPAAAPAAEKNKENAAPADEWQTAGSDHAKRQNRPQSISGGPEEKGTMGYVRNVTEKVDGDALRAALSAHGQLVYFDVNRGKNCAFVEFATAEGYQAAAAANPHQVNGEPIYVEARRPKAGAYGSNNYTGGRGGAMNGRGRGGFEQNRNGGQGQGGRGNFGGANRGRGGAPGAPARGGRLNQATNA